MFLPANSFLMKAQSYPCDLRGIVKVARVRRHGFSEREIALVRAFLMADIESAYLERDQMQSTSLREEYLQVGETLCNAILFSWFHVNVSQLLPVYQSIFLGDFWQIQIL
jgi:hypothetical protein